MFPFTLKKNKFVAQTDYEPCQLYYDFSLYVHTHQKCVHTYISTWGFFCCLFSPLIESYSNGQALMDLK